MRSSDIFFVSVVTSTRASASARPLISATRSSIWPFVGFTMISGSIRPGRAHDLLDDLRRGFALVRARRRRHEQHLVHPLGELLEPQRPVVHRRRQPEAVRDERLLARPVALELAVQLRDRDVRLVDDAQPVVGEVVEQRVRRLVALAAVEVHRVVLDARHSCRPRAASRGRSSCACAAAALRAACPASRARRAAPSAPPRCRRSPRAGAPRR